MVWRPSQDGNFFIKIAYYLEMARLQRLQAERGKKLESNLETYCPGLCETPSLESLF